MKYLLLLFFGVFFCCNYAVQKLNSDYSDFYPEKVLEAANKLKTLPPSTVTSVKADRSEGGIHDYYSEGPYWWPDSTNIDGPYIRRDGIRNPNNFTSHRSLLKKFETNVVSLTAAFVLTKDISFVEASVAHLDAWFIANDTKMNPNLLYGQAIKGITAGRGIGIIDAIGLINVSNAIMVLKKEGQLSDAQYKGYQLWFEEFVIWLTSHSHGIEEMTNDNNHSTWWGAQVASYSILCDRNDILEIAVNQYKNQLDIQMDCLGALPEELSRTKPFHYMNYTLEAWNVYATLISHFSSDMWNYNSPKGSLEKAEEFAYVHMNDIENWPYKTELEPVPNVKSQLHFWLASKGFGQEKYYNYWKANRESDDSNNAALILWQYILKK